MNASTPPSSDDSSAPTSGERISVLIVDDHAVVREGLKLLLNAQSDMDVVGECSDGSAAVAIIADLSPQIAIVDLSMRGLHGVATTQRIREASPRSRVIAFTVHEEPELVREMLSAGASGYVLKRSSPDELLTAIRTAARAGTYIDPQLGLTLPRNGRGGGPVGGNIPLSNRETEVIRLLAAGHTNKDIAEALGVSVKTVETYKARVMSKLNLERRVDIVRYASRQGWLTDL